MSKLLCGECGKRGDFFTHICEECWHKRVPLAEARQAFLKELQMVADYSDEKRLQATAQGVVILFKVPKQMKKIREWHAKRKVKE